MENNYSESTMFVSPEGTLHLGNYLQHTFRTAITITGIVAVYTIPKQIPKGADLYSNGKFVAKIVRDMPIGHLAQPTDFEPVLPIGSTWDNTLVIYNSKVIYKHPNFM